MGIEQKEGRQGEIEEEQVKGEKEGAGIVRNYKREREKEKG